jgi:histidinol phosphatase-like PHP family hydrolase
VLNVKEDYHVHTNFNDHSPSNLSVQNIIKIAERRGLTSIAFTEHVRKSSQWISEYLEEIDKIRTTNPRVQMITGFEAKILEEGAIDFPEIYSDHFVIASFHTTYGNKKKWFHALKTAIECPYVNVIGHLAPEQSFNLDESELDELAVLLYKYDRTIELNAKYKRPPLDWLRIFKKRKVQFHLGSDAHRLEDIGNFESIRNLITFIDGETSQME